MSLVKFILVYALYDNSLISFDSYKFIEDSDSFNIKFEYSKGKDILFVMRELFWLSKL